MSDTPTPTIVLPLDGSETSERAKGLAVAIARRAAARLVLVGAPEIYGLDMAWSAGAGPDAGLPMIPIDTLMQEVREATAAYLGQQREAIAAQGVAVETAVVDEMPARAIAEVAGGRNAFLVVMATHGRGGLSRWALGSVADKVLQTSPAPVLLVRAGAGHLDPKLDHILVTLDGSALAEAVLPDVERLALALGSRVTLAFVSLEARLAIETSPMLVAQEREVERMTGYLDRQAERLEAAGIRAGGEVLAGPSAAEALIERAGRGDVDLVALTTHGRGGLSRWVYGSVADRVIRGAGTPVLVRRSHE